MTSTNPFSLPPSVHSPPGRLGEGGHKVGALSGGNSMTTVMSLNTFPYLELSSLSRFALGSWKLIHQTFILTHKDNSAIRSSIEITHTREQKA